MIEKKLFDNYNGKDVILYELSNEKLKVGITDFGGAIQYINVNTKNGEKDVCLGFDNVKDYLESGMYCGATIGRVANRIKGAKFKLEGQTYNLTVNDGKNHLHGGVAGFDKQFFSAEINGNILKLSRLSCDGEEGYPGDLNFCAEFELIDNALEIRYSAYVSGSKSTVWCPTCHVYFNLDNKQSICHNLLQINAGKFMPIDKELIPTGEVMSVDRTPFDFSDLKTIGRDINADDEQLKLAGGYDHNFILDGQHAATAVGVESGIKLEVYTDMPGLQFYSGNMIKGNGRAGKLVPRQGFCLEPQYFPNAVNVPWFETPILKAGEVKTHYIRYEFC